MTKLSDIEQISPLSVAKFHACGIDSLEKLLEFGKTPEKRKQLSTQIGVNSRRILAWVNHADFARIKGIGEEYTELLEAAGVNSLSILANYDPNTLHVILIKINAHKKLVKRVPAISRVIDWIEQAKLLPQLIEEG